MSLRLLFVVLIGQGHINPMLPLAEEAVRRGHRVEFATCADHAAEVAATGARWVELPGPPPFEAAPVSGPIGGPAAMGVWARHYTAAMAAAQEALHRHCAADPPDVIVYDSTNWPGRLTARSLGLPSVRCVPYLASSRTYSLNVRTTDGLRPGHPALEPLAADCAEFTGRTGFPLTLADVLDENADDLNLIFVPRAFQPAVESFGPESRFIGPTLGDRERAESGTWSPRHPGLPLVYVSLGSALTGSSGFYRVCADAFADGRWEVAMTVGGTDPAGLGPLPPTVTVRQRFPQLAVLGRATAFITHAGMNSVAEALYQGVGTVALPFTGEQAVNADRLRELGLGERLSWDGLSADVLRSAVERVAADPAMRARRAELRASVRDSGGAVLGMDLVEAHLRGAPAVG